MNSLSNEELIQVYQDKALVCLCDKHCGDPGSSWCPPQKKARRALEILTSRGVEMPQGLHLALSEDESCGRRSNSSGT